MEKIKRQQTNFAKEYPQYTLPELLELPFEYFIKIPIRINPLKKILVQKYGDMSARCENVKCGSYKWYGKKGIRVEISKEDFYLWFFREVRKYYLTHNNIKGCCVGRIDHSKNYTLGNIELISRTENLIEQSMRLGNPNPQSFKFDDCVVLMAHTVKTPSVELAKLYKCTSASFNRMRNGSNWKWVNKAISK